MNEKVISNIKRYIIKKFDRFGRNTQKGVQNHKPKSIHHETILKFGAYQQLRDL